MQRYLSFESTVIFFPLEPGHEESDIDISFLGVLSSSFLSAVPHLSLIPGIDSGAQDAQSPNVVDRARAHRLRLCPYTTRGLPFSQR